MPINLEHDYKELRFIKAFKVKEREGAIDRVIDAHYAIRQGLCLKERLDMSFSGILESFDMSRRGRSHRWGFWKSGKFKLYFKDGIRAIENDAGHVRLLLRFKRHAFDKENKRMFQ